MWLHPPVFSSTGRNRNTTLYGNLARQVCDPEESPHVDAPAIENLASVDVRQTRRTDQRVPFLTRRPELQTALDGTPESEPDRLNDDVRGEHQQVRTGLQQSALVERCQSKQQNVDQYEANSLG